jgi:hypothetical protein
LEASLASSSLVGSSLECKADEILLIRLVFLPVIGPTIVPHASGAEIQLVMPWLVNQNREV